MKSGDLKLLLTFFSSKAGIIDSKNRDKLLLEFYEKMMAHKTDVLGADRTTSSTMVSRMKQMRIGSFKRSSTSDLQKENSETKILNALELNNGRRLLIEAGLKILYAAILTYEESCTLLIELYAVCYFNARGWNVTYKHIKETIDMYLINLFQKKDEDDIETWAKKIEEEVAVIFRSVESGARASNYRQRRIAHPPPEPDHACINTEQT